jgi:hypothetical protein
MSFAVQANKHFKIELLIIINPVKQILSIKVSILNYKYVCMIVDINYH